MPLYLRKYNDATERYEYVLEKSWKDQRDEARAEASLDENAPPARATDPPSANPSRRPWFVILFVLLGVIIAQAGLLGSILLRAAPEPKPSVPQPPAIVTEEVPVEPRVTVNADVPPPPAHSVPPPPPPPDPPIPAAPVKLLEIPKDLVPEKVQEDVRAEAIAAEQRAEQAFNAAADRFPKPRARPLERPANPRDDAEATLEYVEPIVKAYFSGVPLQIRRYRAQTRENRELIQTVEASAQLPHSRLNDLRLRRCLQQARSQVQPVDPRGAPIQGHSVLEPARKKAYRNWLNNHPIK